MRIDRKIVPMAAVLEVVAGHPVIFVGSKDVFDELPVFPAMQFCSARTRRTHIRNGETLIKRHRNDRGFPVSGMTLKPDLLCIDGLIRFEVVQRTARAPT